ncbi:MAG: U32 family peptidase [Candidatus Limiplasma sp.]|nr:U32 family peptidase [Candidatus Limiplasma sp.]
MKPFAKRALPELLAPAGDEEALRAAVCAGADAVYLGFRAFSARATAANFDGEQLAWAVQYAHLHHVRVHVTVNTLVKEKELQEVYAALETIAHARADAVIVQDLGVAAMVREHFPTLDLHASTQMSIHNATGVRWAKAMGVSRVVLARECSLGEIAKAAGQGVELEVFVHGALCSSVSGQCLMSSMAGGRSGNRGRCAQPCRQELRLGERRGALLSLRDLCLRDQLPLLVEAGVDAFKIEGRLKRPEYVAVVVESYRRALDGLARGEAAPMDRPEREWLMQAFHRGGFTRGHGGGDQDAALADPGRVGHGGLPVGKVTLCQGNLARVLLSQPLEDGDGLQIRGVQEIDLRYAGQNRGAGEEAVLRLRPGVQVRAGDEVFRLTQERQMAWAKALCQEKPLPVAMEAALAADKPMELTLKSQDVKVAVQGDVVSRAQSRSATQEEVRRHLGKLGGSPFALEREEDLKLDLGEGLFAPVSSLNALRRAGIEALTQARCAAFFGAGKESWLTERENRPPEEAGGGAESAFPKALPPLVRTDESRLAPALWGQGPVVSFRDAAMAHALREAGASMLVFEPWDCRSEALGAALPSLPQGTWLALPPFLSEAALEEILPLIRAHAALLGGVAVGSVGQLGLELPVPVALGSGVPVTNSLALQALSQSNPRFFLLWPEWSYGELAALPRTPIPRLLTAYGRERVMLLHHCPERVAKGLGNSREACALCRGGEMACGREHAEMADRKGYRFPLSRTVTREGCLLNVYNALPTDLRKQEDKRLSLGAGMLVSLTVESKEEQLALVRAFAALAAGGPLPPESRAAATTAGHLLRGVE